MSNIIPVTIKNHAEKTWKAPADYRFANTDTVCPLAFQELPRAIMGLPVGFFQIDDRFVLAAIQGLSQNSNLFVDNKGAWQGRYIPAIYRCYPFLFTVNTKGEPVFSVDEDSGLVAGVAGGEPFFDDSGELTAKTRDVLDSLSQHRVGRESTQHVCKILQDMNLIEPWKIQLSGFDGKREVAGFYRINETALNQLSAISLKKLRDARALSVAYCQLLSMAHIDGLIFLANAASAAPAGDSELVFDALSENGGSISFDNI